MPSIPHRADLRQRVLPRAKSGLAALPAGIARAIAGWITAWFDDWRALRHIAELDDYLLRDIGLRKDGTRGSAAAPCRDAKAQATKETLIWPTIF